MAKILLLVAVLSVVAICSCQKLEGWRNKQIQQIHQGASSNNRLTPPTQPIEIPEKDLGDFPADPSFVIVVYSTLGNTTDFQAISGWDAEQTVIWYHTKLNQLGYDSGDNISRILDGATYFPQQDVRPSPAFDEIYVKVSMNTSDQVVIEVKATKN